MESNTSTGGMARKNDNGFDIESLPCCRLLSIKEKKLCSLLRLRPTHYVTLKTLILKDHGVQKPKRVQAKTGLENTDKSMRRKIVNFMIKSGWISAF